MRFYWLKYHVTQKFIKVYWKRGKDEDDPNRVDYHTKHHAITHHKGVRSDYILDST